MRTSALIVAVAVSAVAVAVATPSAAGVPASADSDGIVYRYYAGWGLRFQPLLSFGNLNSTVSAHDAAGARRLADALVARGVRRGNALYWEYDFSFGGGPTRWTSGFTQAVAAQALARAGALLRMPSLGRAADAAFRGLRETLLMPLGGGSWIREYSYTSQVILNAQLESLLAIESYARIAKTAAARGLVARLELSTRTLLPRFELGCWARYQLDGPAADVHYQTYHVDLLRRVAATHEEPIWRATYLRWKGCLR